VRFFKLVEHLYVMKIGTSAYTFTGRRGKRGHWNENVALGLGTLVPFSSSSVQCPRLSWVGGAGINFDWCITVIVKDRIHDVTKNTRYNIAYLVYLSKEKVHASCPSQ